MTDRATRLQRAYYRARRRKHGACSVCQFREAADGYYHCRHRPDRQGGQCATDDQLPKFRLDEDVWNDPKGAS